MNPVHWVRRKRRRSPRRKISISIVHTLEYPITVRVQHPTNVNNGTLDFIWLANKDNLMLLTSSRLLVSI